jgi:hypothetical protein
MFCKGPRKNPHRTRYRWVDYYGNFVPNPPKARRRRFAHFERRDRLATCQECGSILNFQGEQEHRGGYSRVYYFACKIQKCGNHGRRLIFDPKGRRIRPPQANPHVPKLARSCPVCGGKLWRSGKPKKYRPTLTELHCNSALENKFLHITSAGKFPLTFYWRPGAKELLVFDKFRTSEGNRRLMRFSTWKRRRKKYKSIADAVREFGQTWFGVQEFAHRIGYHPMNASDFLKQLVDAGELQRRRQGKGPYLYATNPSQKSETRTGAS